MSPPDFPQIRRRGATQLGVAHHYIDMVPQHLSSRRRLLATDYRGQNLRQKPGISQNVSLKSPRSLRRRTFITTREAPFG